MMRLFVSFLLVSVEIIVNSSDVASNDVSSDKQRKSVVKVYWNVPTFQCDYHKLNFTGLAEKYNIVQNRDDRFWGGNISILYDPGAFPAILKTGNNGTIFRNGGVPQMGNLSYHLGLFRDILAKLVPNENFSGLGIIDFESWRPIFRQNFGSLTPYKNLSIDLVAMEHPEWKQSQIEKEAARRFELHARDFMEATLAVAKEMRPNASWGYYAYPYCFNMSPSNMKTTCPQQVIDENDRIDWLFAKTDNLHPSLYLPEKRLSSMEKLQMIAGRMEEAHRIKMISPRDEIVPYFWYKYMDTQNFVSKKDLFNSFSVLSSSDIDSLVIWGSSNDVNVRAKCLDLYEYVDRVLGPALINNFN